MKSVMGRNLGWLRTIGDRIDTVPMTASTRTPGTVAVPGAVLSYTVIGDLADATADSPPLVLGGSPMDSTGFESLVAGLRSHGVAVSSCSPTRATSGAARATTTRRP